MIFSRVRINAPVLSCIVCLSFLAIYNATFWQEVFSHSTIPFVIALGITVSCIMYAVLTLFSFKYVYKPFLILCFLLAAISAYSMDNFGYVVSTEAFRNIIETDSNEAYDLLHWMFVRDLTIFFIIPSLVIAYLKVDYPTYKVRFMHIILSLILCSANILLFGKYYSSLIRNHMQIKYYINPIRPVYSMVKYTILSFKPGKVKEFMELDSQPKRISSAEKPRLVVLVVGESDRAVNHQLNGYKKQTNPLLGKRRDVLSFSNFHSCGTETTVSIPCMFSVYSREEYNDHKGRYTENVLDLLNKSDVQVLWRDNDGGCKNVCNRIETHDLNAANIQPFCNGFECHDEVLLHNLQDYIDENTKDKLIVLHKKGNHGPAYYKRYPENFAKFSPICNTNDIHKCSNDEIINTYDNIIVYTDYFLDRVINQLELNSHQYQTALIYVSDHGESLGEHGVYLHAMPYWLAPKEQTHVPFIFWASSDFAINHEYLQAIKDNEFSHDHLFHSLLGMFNVQSSVYMAELDMFASLKNN